MCGTLKYGDTIVQIGGVVEGSEWKTGRAISGPWSGFIREENISWWRSQTRLVPVELRVNTFYHGKIGFDVPNNTILAYQLSDDVFRGERKVGNEGDIKIITRRPMNEYEQSIHSRWPVIKVGKERIVFYFQPWDTTPDASPQQLPLL